MLNQFSEYVVYVDESGDHGLKTIDPCYPIFVLAFCIFKKSDYVQSAVPLLQQFKFEHFGHDQIILHETDIRKDRGDFTFLSSKQMKNEFLNQLTSIIHKTPFLIICTVIKKEQYRERYTTPENPYHIALRFGLERIAHFLPKPIKSLHIVVEKRGKVEDDELELEFRRICSGNNYMHQPLPFELVFADKKSNSAGLQLADIVARPIGLNILKPNQPNRAFEIINEKFYRSAQGNINGYGLKCFP